MMMVLRLFYSVHQAFPWISQMMVIVVALCTAYSQIEIVLIISCYLLGVGVCCRHCC